MGKIALWRTYSEEEFAKIVNESTSFQDLAEKLGYARTGGGTAETLKNAIKERNLDISHFTGQAWNKDNFDYSRFKYGNAIKSANALAAIVALRGHQCENCKLTNWLNKPIPLEIHHKDGDHLNNDLDNLQLLCPNCHAFTENYRGKNIVKEKRKETISEDKFVEALQNNKSIRQALLSLGLSGAGANYERAYSLIQQYDIQHLKK